MPDLAEPNSPPAGPEPFVRWFRQATPYVHAHRGRTFVIAFGGEAVAEEGFSELVHDLALLHGLGIRLVLAHGARPQIEERLRLRGVELHYVEGLRVTDTEALACVKEAAGVVRVEIEALLSLGLANSPMAGVRIPVASGNFVTAKPLGVLDGVDYRHTGVVRRIDRESLRRCLNDGTVALMPPLGYSPPGDVFNLSAVDVACSTAIALRADKLIFLLEEPGVSDASGSLVTNLLSRDIESLLTDSPSVSEELAQSLRAGAHACIQGVERVHLVGRRTQGALLRELFTRDGAGTMITASPYEELRPARIDDVGGYWSCCVPWSSRVFWCGAPASVWRPRSTVSRSWSETVWPSHVWPFTVFPTQAWPSWPAWPSIPITGAAPAATSSWNMSKRPLRDRESADCSCSRPRPPTGSGSGASSPRAWRSYPWRSGHSITIGATPKFS